MSFNHSGLGVFWQDWPGWPRISRRDPVGQSGYLEASPANLRDKEKSKWRFTDEEASVSSVADCLVA
jgi:hypothetical protein